MEARGRGRGLGKARGTPAAGQQPPQRPGTAPGGVRPQAPAPSSWVRPQAPQQQAPAAAPPQVSAAQSSASKVTGAGDAPVQGASVRGRVVNRREILYTKPSHIKSKVGTIGTPIDLQTNYFQFNWPGKWCLYQYRVDMAPDTDHTRKRCWLLRCAVEGFLRAGYIFDGTLLATPERLHPDPMELFVPDGEEKVRVTIRMVGELKWGDHQYIQVFNIIIRKCLQELGLTQVGRNYFLPQLKINIPEHKVQLWPGFITSTRQHEKNILLNVDLQWKFMRTDSVYDLLLECDQRNIQKDFQSRVIGSTVLTSYNNKTYRIDDVDFTKTVLDTFDVKDGTKITYKEYFEKKYKLSIRDLKQPLMVSRCKPREVRRSQTDTIHLVPELCQMTGLTDRQRDNLQLMRTLDSHTKVGPEKRVAKLLEFVDKIHKNPKVLAEIKKWDVDLSRKLVEFKGRVLPQEAIVGGGNVRYPAGAQADWTRDLRSKPMFVSGQLKKLAVICPSRFKQQGQEFLGLLKKAASGMNWSLGACEVAEIPQDRNQNYIEAVDRLVQTCQPTLILVILSTNSADRYSAIKKKCCIEKGVPSQMMVARNLTSKGAMTIATKIVIQINCKIGGAPWSVVMPVPGLMVVGYDVCRDTVNKKKSFAGMVASMDKQMSRYYSAVYEHSMEEELSNYCATFLILACKKYKQVSGAYPERILIYRDGVGEGQLPYVYEHEVTNIKKRLSEEIYKEAPVKFAFIVVTKRINTKIFNQGRNPPPGTIVDDVITLPERYDFYLVSQCVREGTVAPTSYNVLEDTLGLSPERIQILTYKMTHLFYNWSGTIRVPAPCQYAHKLAFFTSQSLHRAAHPDLEDLLFFI